MPGSGERVYAYAKACGIMERSFIGKKLHALEEVSRLSELDRAIFPKNARALPERELLADLEARITERSAQAICSVANSFQRPPKFISLLIRSYEYADLKSAFTAIAGGEPKDPVFTNIGKFGTVNFAAYPNLRAMLEGTEFEDLLRRDGKPREEGIALQTLLDRRYYKALWKAMMALPTHDCVDARRILAEEIALRNALWVLRLRTYYQLSERAIREHLIDIPVRRPPASVRGGGRLRRDQLNKRRGRAAAEGDVPFESGGKNLGHWGSRAGKKKYSLADDAAAALDLSLDTYSDWVSWGRVNFLNPLKSGETWNADPRYFQSAASRYLYHLSRFCFWQRPFSLDPVFCFFKLKQFEEDILTSIAEGIGLGMSSRDVLTTLEVET